MKKVSFIVPTYNEKGSIKNIISSLTDVINNNKLDAEILIVDDSSPDKTAQIARKISTKNKLVKVIERTKDKGFGKSLVHGSKNANGNYIIWTMADGSDNIETYPKIIKKLDEGYDMVIASRTIKGGSRGNQSFLKSFAGNSFTAVSKILFGFKINDVTNAFRGFRKEILNDINLESNDFSISPEFSIKAQKSKLKITEVPTTYKDRKQGTAKFNIIKMGKKYIKLLKYRFRD